MIGGVEIVPLTPHADERGFLMEILRESDPHYTRFGQVYVSLNYPGVIRAWHYHRHQSDTWCVVAGMVKAVMADIREDSPTHGEVQEVFMGDHNHVLLVIPPGVAHGYKTVGVRPSHLLNFTDRLYNRDDPDELRLPWNTPDIPYDWDIRIT